MKLFGSITELVSAIFRKNSQTITLRPNQTQTYTAARDIQLPQADSDQVLVGRTSTDTLTNKTLTAPVISTISNTGTLTLPTSTDTLVGRNTTDTLTNKTIGSGNVLSGATASNFANGGTVTLPTSGTLATLAGSESLTNKNLASSTNTLTGATAASFTNSGTVTLPASGTLATLAGSESLTNKNLASSTNTLSGATSTSFTNGGTVSLPSGTTTLLGNNTSQVVTNKDIDGGTASNTSRITLPSANTATLSGLTRKAGTLVYDSQTGLVNYDNGTTLAALASAGTATPSVAGLVTSYSPIIQNSINAINANYTVVDNDGYSAIDVTTGASTITITLPAAASTNKGKIVRVTKIDSGSGQIVFGSTPTINGFTPTSSIISVDKQYQSLTVRSTGSIWVIEDSSFLKYGFNADNNFTGGAVVLTKIGNQVSMHVNGLSFGSSATPTSSAGVIPSAFRPVSQVSGIIYSTAAYVVMLTVNTAGTWSLEIRDWAGVGSAQTTVPSGGSISWLLRF